MTMTTSGSPASSTEKPSLVHQLQEMNGMEKKQWLRTQRGQPATSKPCQPYQKSYPHTRTNSSTAQSTSPDPSGCSPSRRKDVLGVSRVKTSSSYFDPLPPGISSEEYRSAYSSTISPIRSSSQIIHLPTNHSSSGDSSTAVSYYSRSLPLVAHVVNYMDTRLGIYTPNC